MYKLRLIKGRSFTGFGVKATAQNPFVTVDDEKAEKLIKSGYFTREAVVEEKDDSDNTDTDKNTDENTEPEDNNVPVELNNKKTTKSKKADTLGGELDFSKE